MTDKELRKLKRIELLELLTGMSEENEALRLERDTLQQQLQERRLHLKEAGSIAEAAFQLSGIFEAAQAAADIYLENIKQMNGEAAQKTALLKTDTEA